MRGRVNAVDVIFIGASNELGQFESGLTAQWFGAVRAVVLGGLGTLVVTGIWAWCFPELRHAGSVLNQPPSPANSIYFFFTGAGLLGGIAIDIGVAAPAASSFFTDAEILSAFLPARHLPNLGFRQLALVARHPVNRIPFSTFQYDSHASSSVTPTP